MLFFIADLALSLAFKAGAWCLGGVVYLVKRASRRVPGVEGVDCNDEFIVISRDEYRSLCGLRQHHASDDSSVPSSSDEPSSSSK
jgi:hypothetical protein